MIEVIVKARHVDGRRFLHRVLFFDWTEPLRVIAGWPRDGWIEVSTGSLHCDVVATVRLL